MVVDPLKMNASGFPPAREWRYLFSVVWVPTARLLRGSGGFGLDGRQPPHLVALLQPLQVLLEFALPNLQLKVIGNALADWIKRTFLAGFQRIHGETEPGRCDNDNPIHASSTAAASAF